MRKIALGFVTLLGVLALSGIASADTNITTTVITNDTVNSVQNIGTNESVRVWMNGIEWSGVPKYISQREGKWLKDREGIEMEDVARAFLKMESVLRGEEERLSDEEKAILKSVMNISDRRIEKFAHEYVIPRMNSQESRIQELRYEVDAMDETFRRLHPYTYCNARISVMKENNLTSVTCGSKKCYNGEERTSEGGRDWCLLREKDDPHSQYAGVYGGLKNLTVEDGKLKVVVSNGKPGLVINPWVKVIVTEPTGKPVKEMEPVKLDRIKGAKTEDFVDVNTDGLDKGNYRLVVRTLLGNREVIDGVTMELERNDSGRVAELENRANSIDKRDKNLTEQVDELGSDVEELKSGEYIERVYKGILEVLVVVLGVVIFYKVLTGEEDTSKVRE
ncbi:hypothetical protein AKJ56_00385 [candidate division MSBL1 archaeon SCGC-AAA382N08]|uniref:Uncharacterized protein n=1 Tax=candidate division MSBL1 archaeon SCGC-AAA382N08 TaxID=1698285 RepID=A0A133VQP0_9EURY|nr:hypothetical protein AKJ56_00385 [candidate division MSBL1 archaeon SCGC-AAA382N08]